jgi:large subunit ribosomal protein L15
LPGFRSFKAPVEAVYTGQLDALSAAKVINTATLAEAGLITNAYVRVKLIVKGDVTKKHDVKLQAASATAVEAVQKAGGTFEKVAREARPVTRKKD